MTLNDPEIVPRPYRRKVTISMGGNTEQKDLRETVLEIMEG
jgi:kinesin family member 20